MTPERIAELETLAAKASKGRWEVGTCTRDDRDGERWITVGIPTSTRGDGKSLCIADCGIYGDHHHEQSYDDAHFIAASRDGVVGLIEHIVAQEQELNLLREALESVAQASNAVSMFR